MHILKHLFKDWAVLVFCNNFGFICPIFYNFNFWNTRQSLVLHFRQQPISNIWYIKHRAQFPWLGLSKLPFFSFFSFFFSFSFIYECPWWHVMNLALEIQALISTPGTAGCSESVAPSPGHPARPLTGHLLLLIRLANRLGNHTRAWILVQK